MSPLARGPIGTMGIDGKANVPASRRRRELGVRESRTEAAG
jgi:hypothetical protein